MDRLPRTLIQVRRLISQKWHMARVLQLALEWSIPARHLLNPLIHTGGGDWYLLRLPVQQGTFDPRSHMKIRWMHHP